MARREAVPAVGVATEVNERSMKRGAIELPSSEKWVAAAVKAKQAN